MKNETYQEYLARGGKVTKCPPVGQKSPRRKRRPSEAVEVKPLNASELNLLPASLKISLGLK